MKKLYNRPEVSVVQISTMSVICASGGAGGGSGANKVNTGVYSDDQW